MEKPKQLSTEEIDLSALREVCQDYIDLVADDALPNIGDDDDLDDYYKIYETAMETIFGKEVWKFINRRID